MSQKWALTPTQMESLRQRLQRVIDRDFGGKQIMAARSLGLSQSQLSQILSSKAGSVGVPTLLALAHYEDCTIDAILGTQGRVADPHVPFPPALLEALEGRVIRPSTRGALRGHLQGLAFNYTAAHWKDFIDGLEKAARYAEMEAELDAQAMGRPPTPMPKPGRKGHSDTPVGSPVPTSKKRLKAPGQTPKPRP